ncbi:MAG: hypothetical protein GW848_02225 [Rhodoferax sp.]|nr:hypothetical protein [Rhodoferax sp.]
MKSSKFALIALAASLALGTAVFAKGPAGGQAAGASSGGTSAGMGAGGQARSHNPGVGTATRTQEREQVQIQAEDQIRARLHTMNADGVPSAGTGPAVVMDKTRGIHTPGTGLAADPGATAVTPAVVTQ